MNEELDKYMKRVLEEIEEWEESKSLKKAKELNLDLTFMKALIRSVEFNELNAFVRYLNETETYIKKHTTKEENGQEILH